MFKRSRAFFQIVIVLVSFVGMTETRAFAQATDRERQDFARQFITNLVTADTGENFKQLYPEGVPQITLTKSEIQELVAPPRRKLSQEYLLYDLFPENLNAMSRFVPAAYEPFRRTRAISPGRHDYHYLWDSQNMLLYSLILLQFEEKVFSRNDLAVFGLENIRTFEGVLNQTVQNLASEADRFRQNAVPSEVKNMIPEKYKAAVQAIPNWRLCRNVFHSTDFAR